jgi:hypothetical protein
VAITTEYHEEASEMFLGGLKRLRMKDLMAKFREYVDFVATQV